MWQAITSVKFADLIHTTKPFHIHEEWTMRITSEVWALAEKEKALGLPPSNPCKRDDNEGVPVNQMNFFRCVPVECMDFPAPPSPRARPCTCARDAHAY